MAQLINFSTRVNQMRLLIADIDDDDQVFNDEAIQAFLDMALDNNLKRAAASALLVMATNEVLVQKRIKLLDLSTDGPAEAEALRQLAQQYRAEADAEEVTGAFDWAEMVQTPAQYRERLYKEAQRA